MHHKQLIALLLLLLLTACGRHRQANALLSQADSLMASRPDSVYALLTAVTPDERSDWRRADRMRYELTLAEAMNKAYKDFTTDSALKQVVRYYDRRGSRNQQLKAHYLLGCAYRDMGEAPAAINAWQKAVDCADTTSADCDYNTLYRVYGQMAELFHNRLSFSEEIQCLWKASSYAYAANDTLAALFLKNKIGGTYMLLNQNDSAESVLHHVQQEYKQHTYYQQSLTASLSLIYLYTYKQDRMNEAKSLMDRYESLSQDFDEHHELHPSRRQYYSYKGLYYENLGLLDSAEHYYRKVFRPNMDYISKNPMYEGLLSVFTKRHQADSIAKYARLYCEANDSSIAIKDRELTALVAANYNYTRFQQDASKQRERALRNANQLIIVSVAALILIALALSLILQYRKRQRQKQEELNQMEGELMSTKQEYERNQLMLNNLKFIYHEALSEQKTAIAELTSRFSESEKALQTTIRNQSTHIEVLEQRLGRQTLSDPQLPLFSNPFITHIIEVAGKPNEKLSQADWNRLMEIWRGYYPKLTADLLANHEVTKQGLRVCLLTTLFLRGKDIANLLQVSSGRITNLRADVNEAMFGIKDAKALLPNLIAFYHIQQPYEENNNTEG